MGKVSKLGPYTILKEIGAGGYSTVKLATDQDGREVALKILKDDLTAAEIRLQEAEVDILKKLNGGNDRIIQILDSGTDEYIPQYGKSRNVSYIAIEYAQQGDLFDEI